MRRDALELDRFYRDRRGATVRALIARRLASLWPDVSQMDVLGVGYPTPLLEAFRSTARRCIAFMPAGQGAIASQGRASTTAMGDETRLPFVEALFDRILLIHALEEADSPAAILREAWRVLAPEGRIVIIVPARAGVWAWMDSTPFGHGRPFSRGQLAHLLETAMFEPTAWSRALYAPPWRWSARPGIAELWEKAGEAAWAGLGGVILVEAIKRSAALRPRPVSAIGRLPALEGRPAPALSRHERNCCSLEE